VESKVFAVWKFQAEYEYGAISLHDCHITSIVEKDNNIELYFADGYWLSEANNQNPYKKILRTDASCLTLLNANCEDIFFGGTKLSWDKFCSNITSGQWSFECITECYAGNKSVYSGWIWTEEGFYQPNPECNIWFTFQKLVYNWNNICEDRQW